MRAVILAAGAGTRLGGPKARLLVGGVPLALAHVRRAREAGCSQVVVVTQRSDKEWIGREPGADAVVSEEPDQAGSLRVGLHALLGDGDGLVLVTPVDVLPARVDTIRQLVGSLGQGISAVSPAVHGVGGHPVVLRASALRGYPGVPLREVLEGLGAARLRLEVDDSNVVTDLDTPADVVAATGSPPVFLAVSPLRLL